MENPLVFVIYSTISFRVSMSKGEVTDGEFFSTRDLLYHIILSFRVSMPKGDTVSNCPGDLGVPSGVTAGGQEEGSGRGELSPTGSHGSLVRGGL